MAAAISAKYECKLNVDETLALGLDHVDDPETTHSLGNDNGTLTATTTPPATKTFSDRVTLSGGSGALDLTSLTGPMSTTIDFTGLKVQLVKLKCPDTNTGPVTVEKKDALTGYNLFGADNTTDEKISIVPGGVCELYYDDELEDVDATHKDITLTGTGTEPIDVQLVAG